MQPLPVPLVRALERRIAQGIPPLAGIDAADLRQEALLAWWQVQQRYDPARGVPLAAYAWPRVRGRVADQCRQATHRGQMTWYALPGREPADTPPVREVWLRARVNRLPRRARLVIIRRYWSGWTLKHIARALGVSERRAWVLHRGALQRLRLMVGRDLLEAG